LYLYRRISTCAENWLLIQTWKACACARSLS
jgi:hypothetical protein